MADPQPTTSKETDQDMNPDFVNRLTNKESARFLMRVLQKVEEENKKIGNLQSNDRAGEFTGLDTRAFYNKSLKNDLKQSDLKEVERTLIHDQLMNCYFLGNAVPSTKVLYRALFEQIPSHVDIRTFRKYLAKYGYVWLRFPNGFGVIERPKVTFDRYFYLRDIIRYRKEKREIFYVDEAILSTSTGEYYDDKRYKSLKNAALSAGKVLSHKDLIKVTYAVSKSGVYALSRLDVAKCSDNEFSPVVFKEWLLTKLLPILPSNSAVVIKSDKHRKAEKPSLYSVKIDMMEWLDSNNIPYIETMSKCELLTLIDTYTSEIDRNNDIESLINSSGHVLLQLPFFAEKISVAHHVFNLIKLNAKSKLGKGLENIFDAISPEQLKAYDENILELEKETFEIDMKVDEILDELIFKTGAKRTHEYDSEVPLSDSD